MKILEMRFSTILILILTICISTITIPKADAAGAALRGLSKSFKTVTSTPKVKPSKPYKQTLKKPLNTIPKTKIYRYKVPHNQSSAYLSQKQQAFANSWSKQAKVKITYSKNALRLLKPNGNLNAQKHVETLKSQAAGLVPKNAGKNRLTLTSPGKKVELDLAGSSHGGVKTPHVKVSSRNLTAPKQPAYNTKKAKPVDATQKDIRLARKYLDRK